MLRKLSDAGVIGMPHPDVMIGYVAKDALSEMHCSCVDFTSHLKRGIQDIAANKIMGMVTAVNE